jgi:S1-C subfamily serine protease
MTQTKRIAAIVAVILAPLTKSASANDAGVTILITESTGAQAFGSGFISSDNGEVITCFHVVEGAARIRVLYKKNAYDADVIAIAPARDVAKLRMVGVPLPTPFMRARYDLPPNLTNKTLTVEAFVLGLSGQQTRASATQDQFATTDQLSGTNLERLFAEPGIKVLPLTLTIVKGMSGAPVTEDGDVLGILSGSLNQGGSFAWAIAIENSRPEFMTNVSVPVAQLRWPRLSLMAGDWSNLRRESGIGQDLVDKVEAATQSLNNASKANGAVCVDDEIVVHGVSALLETFDAYPNLRAVPLTALDQSQDGRTFHAAFDSQLAVLNPQMGTASNQLAIVIAAQRQLVTSLEGAKHAFEVVRNDLPQTPRNSAIMSQIQSQLTDLDAELAKVTDAEQTVFQQVVPVPQQQTYVSDWRANYAAQLTNWSVFQRTVCTLYPRFFSALNAKMVDYRLLLNADIVNLPGN